MSKFLELSCACVRIAVFETVLNQLKETVGFPCENKVYSDVLTFSSIKFLSCTLKRKNKVMTSRKRVLLFKLSLKITEFQVCKRVKHPLANIGIYSLPLHINYFRPGPCILIISCSSFLNAF